MKKCLVIGILSLYAAGLHAQDWPVAATIDPYPSPYLSDWQSDPTIAYMELTNPTARAEVVIVYFAVENNQNRSGFQGQSRRLHMLPGETVLFNAVELENWQTSGIDPMLRNQAMRSGMLPEGDYTAGISVRDTWGRELASGVQAGFSIVQPDPPELVFPIDRENLIDLHPVFQWLPVQIPGDRPYSFHFRLVELLPGQTPQSALETNYVHHENRWIQDENYDYPFDALPLEYHQTYAWQVQAVDPEGRGLTKNSGYSEIGVFTTFFDPNLQTLQLIAPEHHSQVGTRNPVFEWQPLLSDTEVPLNYHLRLVEIPSSSGLLPGEAFAYGRELLNVRTTVTMLNYPFHASALQEGKQYVWQVQGLNAFGEPAAADQGKSGLWSFEVDLSRLIQDQDPLIPEILPLPTESVAYIRLKQGGRALARYTVLGNGSQIQVNLNEPNSAFIVIPALRSEQGPVAIEAVKGILNFYTHNKQVFNTAITAAANTDLTPCGIPLVLTNMTYNPSDGFRFDSRLQLFGREFPQTLISRLDRSGTFTTPLPCTTVGAEIPLVAGSDRLTLALFSIWAEGNQIRTVLNAPAEPMLFADGAVHYAVSGQAVEQPIRLRTNGLDIEIEDSGVPVSLAWSMQNHELVIQNLVLYTLEYFPDFHQHWSFRFTGNLEMSLSTPVELVFPPLPAVDMTEKGIEIPGQDLALPGGSFFEYAGVYIKPYAYHLPDFTYDWYHDDGTGVDWRDLFDYEIDLPLPDRLSGLDAPYTANRIQWRNGRLDGAWVPRQFDFPVAVPLSDAGHAGLLVHALSGRFIENGITIQIDADLDFPSIPSGPSGIIDLQTPLALSPGGLFSGNEVIAGSLADIPWGANGLMLNPGVQSVISLSGESGVQQANLAFNGSITLPSCGGPGAVAAGSGVFNLIDGTLQSGRFVLEGNTVFCVPSDRPVFTFRTNSGGTVSASGLALEDGGGSLLFENGSQIPCSFSKVGLGLPSWTLESGEIGFQGRFGLVLSSFHGEPADFLWEAMPFDAGAVAGVDNVFMNLPGNARITNGVLEASGETPSAQIWFTNQMHTCSTVFSSDYRMQITTPHIIGGRIDFVRENAVIATCDAEGMHFGDYFGSALVAENILLPSLEIGYIPLTNETRGRLDVQQEGDRVRITTLSGQKVPLMLPAFASGDHVPSADIVLNLVVDPRTGRVYSDQDLKFDPDPDVDLSGRGYPFSIPELVYTRDHRLTASLSPVLPLALRSAAVKLDSISLAASGPETFSKNYNLYEAVQQPLALVRLGDYLQVSLDGVHYLSSEKRLRIAGNLYSPFFQDQTVHFIMESGPSGVVFLFPGGGAPAFTIGAGRLSLLEQNGEPGLRIHAPMDAAEFQVSFAALLSLFEAFELTLPLVRIAGDQITFDMGDQPQATRLFGADLTVTGVAPVLTPGNQLRLTLQGRINLFGEDLPFGQLKIGTEGAIEDQVLYARSGESGPAGSLSAVRLATTGGNLRVSGRVALPDPFEGIKNFTVLFTPTGVWKDTTGINQPVLTVVASEAEGAVTNLGKDDNQSILVPMKIAALTISNQSSSNSAFDGRIELLANAYWPNPAQPALWQTRATLSVNSEGRRIAWTIPGVQAHTQTSNPTEIPINNVLFNKVKDLTVECVNDSFSVVFTSDCGIPGAGVFKGFNADFKENKLRKNAFRRGRFDGAEFDLMIFRVQVSNVNWFFGKNGQTKDVEIKDITFDTQNASAKSNVVKATKYLSFTNAILDGEFVYLSGGIEEFRYVETADRKVLFIKKAHLRVPNKLWAELDLLADIKDARDFRFLVGGTCNLDAFKGEEAFVGATLVGLAEMKDGRPGFGAFFAVHTTDIAVAPPIPITMDGFGAGFFVNTNDEVDRIIRSHLQLATDGIDKDFEAMLSSLRGDNPRSYFKLMIYAKINFPESDGLSCLSLWTLGTDRVRVDVKLTGIGSKLKSLKDFMDFYGSGFIEAAWRQDMSGFDYLAGIITLSATPVVDTYAKDTKLEDTYATKSLITFDVGKATVKLIIAPSTFALHGLISAKTPFFYNLMEAEVAVSTYGFFIRGKYAVGFDLLIVSAEAGLELALYVDHPPNTDLYEWGGFGNAYIQADVLGGFVASARGDLTIGMFAENLNFYLFGTAVLQASVFGIKSSTGLWAKWETGGGFDAGFGVNEEMMARIETCRGKANEIYSAALNVQGMDVNVTGLAALSQNIYRLVTGYKDKEFLDWNIRAMNIALPKIPNTPGDYANLEKIKVFYTGFSNQMGDFRRFCSVWLGDDRYAAPYQWQDKAEVLQSAFVNQKLSELDVALEALEEQVEIGPIRKAYETQTVSVGGSSVPYARIDGQKQQENRSQAVRAESLPGAQEAVWNRIRDIRNTRTEIYEALSKGSGNSLGSIIEKVQSEITPQNMMIHVDELKTVKNAYARIRYQTDNAGLLLPNETQINQLVHNEWSRLNSTERKTCHTCRLNALSGAAYTETVTPVASVTEAEYKDTARQMYRYAPYALMNAYGHQIGNIYESYTKIWDAGQKAFDDAAIDLTGKTDALWDKYYALSENYYQLLKDFKDMPWQSSGKTAFQDTAQGFWNLAAQEFMFPYMNIEITIPDQSLIHFTNLHAYFSSNTFTSLGPIAWSEAQVNFGRGFQSIGKLSPYRRFSFLYPGIYTPDVSSEGINVENILTGRESATQSMGVRIRNAAGNLITWPRSYEANYSLPAGTPGATVTGLNSVLIVDTMQTADLTVHLPDAHTIDLFSKYVSGEINSLRFCWMVSEAAAERIAKYQIQFKRPGTNAFSSPWRVTPISISKDRFGVEDPSVQVELGASALFEASINGIQYTADGEYVLKLEAFKLDNTVLASREIKLYVDKSPPVWRAAAVEIQEERTQWKCRAAVPRATDQNSYIADFPVNGYEARVTPEGVPPDSVGWNSIENLDVTAGADGNPAFLNLGRLPYQKSLDIAFRVKNRIWDSGYSNALTRHIDRLAETQNPVQAEFQFVRVDEDTNIVFRVTRTPSDALSGVHRFTAGVYREEKSLVTGLYTTGTAMPWKPEEVVEGRLVVMPTGSWRGDVYGALRFVVSTWDREGNHTACSYMWTRLQPRPPSDFKAWMASGRIVVAGSFDEKMVQDHVQSLMITVTDNRDSLSFEMDCRDAGGSLWYVIPKLTSYERSWNVSSLIPGDSQVQLQVICRAKQWNPHQQRYQYSTAVVDEVTVYPPMFATVLTGENGNLIIPFENEGFGGQRQADYGVALGRMQGGSPVFDLRTIPSQPDFRGVQVSPGARLALPVQANDCWSRILVAVKAVDLGGKNCMTLQEVNLVPSTPWFSVSPYIEKQLEGVSSAVHIATGQETVQSHFRYSLIIPPQALDRIFGPVSGGSQYGRLDCRIRAYISGADLDTWNVPLGNLSGMPGISTSKIRNVTAIADSRDALYLVVHGITAAGKVSADSSFYRVLTRR